jgi:hypothetical protein
LRERRSNRVRGEEMVMSAISSMCTALGANGPAQDLIGKSDLFGWLVGRWELEVLDNESVGMHRVNSGEWHFAWVLEGRAIQDVMIAPRLSERRAGMPLAGNRYGTGIRVHDAGTDRWHGLWVNPAQGTIETLSIEKRGDEIVETGETTRNVFFEIERESFRYRIEALQGGHWKKIAEITARRVG